VFEWAQYFLTTDERVYVYMKNNKSYREIEIADNAPSDFTLSSYQASTEAPGLCLTYSDPASLATKVYFYDFSMAMIGKVAISQSCPDGNACLDVDQGSFCITGSGCLKNY
jgi:hypothetical protein